MFLDLKFFMDLHVLDFPKSEKSIFGIICVHEGTR